jgi:uncharacterized protein (DUF58 family)
MITADFLTQLKKFTLILDKRVTSSFIGSRESLFGGKGLLFKEHRIYAPGDDIKSIDWRVYGRTDDLYIRKFEEERDLTVHVVIDASASMNFGKKIKKFDYAAMIGMGFAYVAMRNNEKFVISTFAEKMKILRARKGRGQLIAIMNYLNKMEASGKTDLEKSLKQYKKLINTRALVVIISDFLYDIGQIRNILAILKNNNVILVQVLDEMENKLDIEGEFRLKDMEEGGFMRTFISPFLKTRYKSSLADHNAKIQVICQEFKAKFFSVDNSMPIFDVFYKMLK